MKRITNIIEFSERAKNHLVGIAESFEELPVLNFSEFDPKTTAVVNIDIINGFCKEGALASPRGGEIIPYAVKVNTMFKDFTKIFFVDSHEKDCAEFEAYPEHCLKDDKESEIVDELKPFLDEKAVICKKNSVNGFLCSDYTHWLMKNPQIVNFIVIGLVTDICVLNFANTQKTYFNEMNVKSRIIIPIKGVETFQLDATNHDAELMNMFALYNMRMNGMEIVDDVV